MRKTICSAILCIPLAFAGCDVEYKSTPQTQQETQQEVEFYEIPTGNYLIGEIDFENERSICPIRDQSFSLNNGRLLIRKIDHENPTPKDFKPKIQPLEAEVETKRFIKGTYALEPGEYEVWILNKGFKAPITTIKSQYHMQVTPRDNHFDYEEVLEIPEGIIEEIIEEPELAPKPLPPEPKTNYIPTPTKKPQLRIQRIPLKDKVA